MVMVMDDRMSELMMGDMLTCSTVSSVNRRASPFLTSVIILMSLANHASKSLQMMKFADGKIAMYA
jgi:hypothetical protein